MKRISLLSLVCLTLARADDGSDRRTIEDVIGALNSAHTAEGRKDAADLFTGDANAQLDRLQEVAARLRRNSSGPWSEVSKPRIVIESIRFITADVAIVDGAIAQYGSTIVVRRIPLFAVMRREAAGWRIALLRVLVQPLSVVEGQEPREVTTRPSQPGHN